MSLRQLKGVDPEFLSFSRPSTQDGTKLPALRCGDRENKPQEPVKAVGVQPGQETYKNQHKTGAQAQLPSGFPKDQVFSGSYAALRCQPGSPAVRALVLQQALAVADRAFKNLLDDNYQHTGSQVLPARQQRHRFVRKIITSDGILQTDTPQCSNPGPPAAKEAANVQDTAKETPENKEWIATEADSLSHFVVDAPVNIEVSRHLKPVETHAQELSEWQKHEIEPLSCTKDARYYVITPVAMEIDACRVAELSAIAYAQCHLGRLSPAIKSPVFPDAPVLGISRSAAQPPPQPQPKPSASKPSAALQESFKRSLAQAQGQLAPASSTEKPPAQPQAPAAPAAGSQHPADASCSADAAAAAVGVQESRTAAQEGSCVKDEPGKAPDVNPCRHLAAAAVMPQYGTQSNKQQAAPAQEEPMRHQHQKAARKACTSEPSEPQDVRRWYYQAVTKVSYQLQRQLLVESRRRAPFTRSVRCDEEPCVVVYVVVPSDCAVEILHALHLVAQALAPCSSLGLAEVALQMPQASPSGVAEGHSPQWVKPDSGAQKSAQDRYGSARQGRPRSDAIAREWPSILAAAPPKPTSIVLQAITRSMLVDSSPQSMRSMAFSIYSKAAGSQLAGWPPTAAGTATQAAAAQGSAHSRPAEQNACATTAKAAAAAATAQRHVDGKDGSARARPTQTKDESPDGSPLLLTWVACRAGVQAFRVAEHQQACTLASAAAEPAADPDLGKVLRTTEPSANGSKRGSETDKLQSPWRSRSARQSTGGSMRSLSSPVRGAETPNRAASSQSKLPFSDTSSSPESGRMSTGQCSPHNASGKLGSSQQAASSREPPADGGNTPFTLPAGDRQPTPHSQHAAAHTAHDREHVAEVLNQQQPVGWHATTVLHCTYAMRMCGSEQLMVSMAWADSRGALLQQVVEEVPCVCPTPEAQAVTRAWLCAQVLLQRSVALLCRPEGSGFEHLCVTLMPADECEQWVWMHVPQLLEAAAQQGCVLPQRVTNICVAKAAVDDPVQEARYLWWPAAARATSTCIACPAVRPMFLKHVESTPMRTFRQWNTWSSDGDAASEADEQLRSRPSLLHASTATTPGTSPPASSPAPGLATESPPARSPVTNGTAVAGDGQPVAPGKRSCQQPQAPPSGAAPSTPPAKQAMKYINLEPLSSGQIPDSEPLCRPSNGKVTAEPQAAVAPSDPNASKPLLRPSLPNGVAEDNDTGSRSGRSRSASVLGKRPRETSTAAVRPRSVQKNVKQVDVQAQLQSRKEWGASASVMWRTPWGCDKVVGPRGETMRLLHVAVLCQWHVKLAIDPGGPPEKGLDSGAAGHSLEVKEDSEAEQKRHYRVQWLRCTDDCAVASAIALHKLALLNRCHYEIAMESSLGDVLYTEPRSAHWPIHCALAARGCLFSEMLKR